MNIHQSIKTDRQIWKFCGYGFLKNLKFFEPYLLIYLTAQGITLFHIGLLYAVREAVVYLLEIPSGIYADAYGNKKALLLCFGFYMCSFLLFFIGGHLTWLILAMILYGFGEAFRSGAHKSLIYAYLEQKGWFEHKTLVYGRTRSFSLLGSALSSVLAIVLVLNLPGLRWVFLLCTVPYIADFILIYTYPKALDHKVSHPFSLNDFKHHTLQQIRALRGRSDLYRTLLSSSLFDGVFKSLKDYIQPILQALLLTGATSGSEIDGRLAVSLGLVYGVFYLCSSYASRNVYRVTQRASTDRLMHRTFDVLAIGLLCLAWATQLSEPVLVVGAYFVLYVLKDARRPIVVDVLGEQMERTQRTTVLSVDSQLKSFSVIVMAPLIGWLADTWSIGGMFAVVGLTMLVANRVLCVRLAN